jgi:electron transport complex protein RnfC
LISRLLTLSGDSFKGKNIEVRLGTLIDDVLTAFIPYDSMRQLRLNGLMMGVDVLTGQIPVYKTTNAILVSKPSVKKPVSECIRCGACNQVCPMGLLPQQLYWHAKSDKLDRCLDYHLLDCLECRCCDYVCPSQLSLALSFSQAKTRHHQQVLEKNKTDKARVRFEFREFRLERNKRERAEMMAAKKKALSEKMANEQAQKDKIAIAIARVNHKKDSK